MTPLRDVSDSAVTALIAAAGNSTRISGLTHNFYRYPARFSPTLARAAIEAFSSPGDLVLDPFVGGGTTLVEAMALGRNAIGTDISSLATFVSGVKTTLQSVAGLARLEEWADRLPSSIDMHLAPIPLNTSFDQTGYRRHLNTSHTWRIRKAIAQALSTTDDLGRNIAPFARCVVLRTAQWALDGRKQLPNIESFRAALGRSAAEMIGGARELRAVVAGQACRPPSIQCVTRDTIGLEGDPAIKAAPRPKLVITSPPYPGVHVLYHRWQVGGGKETAAPFWIANKLDGDGAAYYTMGSRNARTLEIYFTKLRDALRSIAAVSGPETTIVQVVAFSNPHLQLPRYLAAVDDVGLKERFLPQLKSIREGRLWRTVPNRKWYADQRGQTTGSEEVVLFHKLAL